MVTKYNGPFPRLRSAYIAQQRGSMLIGSLILIPIVIVALAVVVQLGAATREEVKRKVYAALTLQSAFINYRYPDYAVQSGEFMMDLLSDATTPGSFQNASSPYQADTLYTYVTPDNYKATIKYLSLPNGPNFPDQISVSVSKGVSVLPGFDSVLTTIDAAGEATGRGRRAVAQVYIDDSASTQGPATFTWLENLVKTIPSYSTFDIDTDTPPLWARFMLPAITHFEKGTVILDHWYGLLERYNLNPSLILSKVPTFNLEHIRRCEVEICLAYCGKPPAGQENGQFLLENGLEPQDGKPGNPDPENIHPCKGYKNEFPESDWSNPALEHAVLLTNDVTPQLDAYYHSVTPPLRYCAVIGNPWKNIGLKSCSIVFAAIYGVNLDIPDCPECPTPAMLVLGQSAYQWTDAYLALKDGVINFVQGIEPMMNTVGLHVFGYYPWGLLRHSSGHEIRGFATITNDTKGLPIEGKDLVQVKTVNTATPSGGTYKSGFSTTTAFQVLNYMQSQNDMAGSPFGINALQALDSATQTGTKQAFQNLVSTVIQPQLGAGGSLPGLVWNYSNADKPDVEMLPLDVTSGLFHSPGFSPVWPSGSPSGAFSGITTPNNWASMVKALSPSYYGTDSEAAFAHALGACQADSRTESIVITDGIPDLDVTPPGATHVSLIPEFSEYSVFKKNFDETKASVQDLIQKTMKQGCNTYILYFSNDGINAIQQSQKTIFKDMLFAIQKDGLDHPEAYPGQLNIIYIEMPKSNDPQSAAKYKEVLFNALKTLLLLVTSHAPDVKF
jgi:hypothetical protein